MSKDVSDYRLGLEGLSPVYIKAEASGVVGREEFLEGFKKNFRIRVIEETHPNPEAATMAGGVSGDSAGVHSQVSSDGTSSITFDMVGVDAPIANALRRILLAEVPTVAIENVWINQNTSIIQDEVLCHRLGLIPLKADPRKLKYQEDPETASEEDTLVFRLQVKGTRESALSSTAVPGSSGATLEDGTKLPSRTQIDRATYLQEFGQDADKEGDFEGRYTKIYARDLVWVPHGAQDVTFPGGVDEVGPVHPDILIAKLAPGQEINAEMHAIKGIGKAHAKWSPVATAWYRLLPRIDLSEEEPFYGEEAEELKKVCPVGVFDIEELADGKKKGVVARPRDCTLCRECIRKPEMAKRVRLAKVSDHFIFCVESTGAVPARELVFMAIDRLIEKCTKVQEAYSQAKAQENGGMLDAADVAKAAIAAMTTEPDDLSAR